LPTLIALLLVLAVGAYGYNRFQQGSARHVGSEPPIAAQPVRANPAAETPSFGCDGRTHCSQMRSCAEAKFFLEHCPGTKMDGNNDGVPCEQQWCTSSFAK
jgi:hypothetical protein